MRRRRLLRWAQWACTLAAVLAVGVAVASRFWRCEFYTSEPGHWALVERQGLLSVSYTSFAQPGRGLWIVERFPGWDWGLADEVPRVRYSPDWHGGVRGWRGTNGWSIGTN